MYKHNYIRKQVFAALIGSIFITTTLVLISDANGKYKSVNGISAAFSWDSYDPDINGDGTKIVFESDSDFLGECILDNQFEIWLYDTVSMTYTRVTTPFNHSVIKQNAHISADGTKVIYDSV